MSLSAELTFVPGDSWSMKRFGKGDERKLKSHLLMLATFLAGKPENTKRAYRAAIQQFFEMFEWICPEDVTVAHSIAFKKRLMVKGLSDATCYYRVSALRSYFKFLLQPHSLVPEPLIKISPFRDVPRSDIKPYPSGHAVPMQWQAFSTIVNALPADPAGIRDKTILLFFAHTGRRRSEVADLLVKDLDLKAMTYRCHVKGVAKRFPLPVVVYEALKAYWIASGRLKGLRGNAGVFTSMCDCSITRMLDPDKPLSSRMLNKVLTRAAQRADVDISKVKLYGLRSMTVRDLERSGARPEIQEFLGYASPSVAYAPQSNGPTKHEALLAKVRQAAENTARDI